MWGNKRQWMIEKRLNWWSGNIFNAHCSEKSVKFGRKLYPPLLHSCLCAAGSFIQRCVRCPLTMAARKRWRKAAKKEEMAEGDVHSSSYNALSARGASGNRSVITFFYISFWAAKPTNSIGCLLCQLAVASKRSFLLLFPRCSITCIQTTCHQLSMQNVGNRAATQKTILLLKIVMWMNLLPIMQRLRS